MHALIQGVILGVLTAGVYALMASGQTLIFGIMRVVNMAQGAMVILGAYLSFQLFTSWGVDPFLALPITTAALFVVGVGVQWLFLRPLHAGDRSQLSVLVTFAVALLIEGVMSVVWNTTDRDTNTSYVNASWTVFGYRITLVRLWAFLLSLFVLALLYLVLNRTRFGRAVRASVQNPESARLLGVESEWVSAIGYGLGTATAAAAGSVYGMLYPFNPNSHYDLISRLLSIVLLGGLGSIGGAMIGALVISVSSSIVAAVVSPIWSQMTFFIVLLLVLLIRPRGLFGSAVRGAI
ncbi:MAG TPA: branched-chain amino acid ABC transporter permease [Pseudonocardiaceae bacterium]|nr:branched-chain amino acid ABC transporter permease [Pseudonocardiaceae bacterium]